MLHRLCGPPSISLGFSLATVLPRRRASCVNLVTAGVNTHYDELSPFTVWTTRVSNPVCYPHFRVSASVTVQVAAFATGVPPGIRISPLHREFRHPLRDSSLTVSDAVPGLGPGISHPTFQTAYTRFTPNKSEQRLHPPYYRGCWHGVSRCFLWRYRQTYGLFTRTHSSLSTEVYDPKAFILHAALLGQAFAHCPISPTAASRRSLDRVSVPVWLIILSDQLLIGALVSFYLTNKLIKRGLILWR